jgi:2-(1,2-epoxy-1,2-dihydrophenyl)acetyl-CoA isomerase
MNTYTVPMLNELFSVVEDVALDGSIRAVVLTGEGRAFSAGADVKGVDELIGLKDEHEESNDILKLLTRVVLALRQAPKPVIAAVNGVAAGGGANLVLACDIVIASEKAKFAENFINIGLVPDGGGTYFLSKQIGYHRSAEIFFTGRILTAEEALNLGLYNKTVPPEDVMKEALSLAQNLASMPTCAIAAGKAILNREEIPKLRACLEDEAKTQRCMVTTADAKEGITSFAEKRKPKFIGK